MNLNNKRIIITGAGGGIGAAVMARLAAYDGAQIIGVDLDAARVDAAIAAIESPRAKLTSHAADLGQPEGVDGLFDHALTVMGGVDIFIANAGFAYYEQIGAPDWTHIDRIFRVNVYSPIYAAEKMAQLNRDAPYRVVMTASAMARVGLPGYALYGGTKAALHRFAEAYRAEIPDPRSVVLLYPIATRTAFFKSAAADGAPVAFPTQTPEEVAVALVRGLERDKTAIYPSLLFRLLLLLDRVTPARRLTQWVEGRKFRTWLSRRKG